MSEKTLRQIKEGALRPDKGPSGPPPVATTMIIDPGTGKPLSPSSNGSGSASAPKPAGE
jgi:hypothetical protein